MSYRSVSQESMQQAFGFMALVTDKIGRRFGGSLCYTCAIIWSSIIFGSCSLPTRLSNVSESPSYQGVVSWRFHRNWSDVSEAVIATMRTLKFENVKKEDDFGFRYTAATRDGRTVRIESNWENGSIETDSEPILGLIANVNIKIGDTGDAELSKKFFEEVANYLNLHKNHVKP